MFYFECASGLTQNCLGPFIYFLFNFFQHAMYVVAGMLSFSNLDLGWGTLRYRKVSLPFLLCVQQMFNYAKMLLFVTLLLFYA